PSRAPPAGPWSRRTGPTPSAGVSRSWGRNTPARGGTANADVRSGGLLVKIVELTAYHIRIPLRKPVRHASHTRTETDNVLVRCVLDDGTEGFGEGVPREYVTGESIDSALALLQISDLAGQLEGCPSFEQSVRLAERLRLAP